MNATRETKHWRDSREMGLSPMVGVSLLFHLAIFSIILFAPETNFGARPVGGIVYEVNLVEMPEAGADKTQASVAEKKGKAESIVKKNIETRRIKPVVKKEKPIVIAKRTIEKKKEKPKKPRTSPSALIEKAISKIESKVKTEDKKNYVDRAISKLERKSEVEGSGSAGRPGGRSLSGIPIDIYRVEAESWIKSNWAYPVAMDNAKDLEAVVVLKVKSDGSILKTRFEKRSSHVLFDESVSKAIERSDPLPPFPEGYRKSYEEFVINFNLKDLENR